MSSIQERLQLKRVPLDTWNTREQLCLASAVVRSGDQNWMSVSRALKTIGEPNRPPDWYSQKCCAAQYGALLEHVETPKRKKRNSEGGVETPQESILKKLTQERIVEIQKTLAEMNQQYEQLQNEVVEARNPSTSDDRLREIWSNIEASKRAKERENAHRAALMKEREESRAKADRGWRPSQPTTPTSPVAPVPGASPAPAPPASPLLTSLLKSSPVVTTPQHISHPANVVETVSPSVTAPTLSMLLEKSSTASAQHESKHAAIEHIKSQLQQIEHQLKANISPAVPLAPSPAPAPSPALALAAAVPAPATPHSPPHPRAHSPAHSHSPAPAPALDIDDIEIKAEDVYAFRDVDIHIPPVTTMHKGNNRTADKPLAKKDEMEENTTVDVVNITQPNIADVIKEEPITIENVDEDVLPDEMETVQEEPPVEQLRPPMTEEPTREPESEIRIAFPEVKFPTTEIKVIQPEDQKIKEEIKEPELPPPEPEKQPEEAVKVEKEAVVSVAEEETEQPQVASPVPPPLETPAEETPLVEPPANDAAESFPLPANIPLPPEPADDQAATQEQAATDYRTEPPLPPEPEVTPVATCKEEPLVEVKIEQPETEVAAQKYAEVAGSDEKSADDVRRDDDAEDLIPLKQMIKEEGALPREARPPEEAHTETDDDTPMELSREEEKDGKKKRDYSRKKKSDSRTCSGSESAAEASAPESPSANDAERQHRLWKKSVMLVYSRLCAHKYASLFLRPISDEEAPGYSVVVKRPMDLSTIRRNIDNGVVRTTAQFQRDVLLMLSNALMYNSSEHSVYAMAKEMHQEAACQLGMLLAAQAHAGLCEAPPHLSTRKRRRPDSPLLPHAPHAPHGPHALKRHH